MRVDNAMLVNVAAREEDAFAVMRRLLTDNHEERRAQLRLAKRGAVRLARSLVVSEVLTRLEEVDGFGRRYVLTEALPDDFASTSRWRFRARGARGLDPEARSTARRRLRHRGLLDAPRRCFRPAARGPR